MELFVNRLSLKEIISGLRLTFRSGGNMDRANATIVCMMFGDLENMKDFLVRHYDLLHRLMFHDKVSCSHFFKKLADRHIP